MKAEPVSLAGLIEREADRIITETRVVIAPLASSPVALPEAMEILARWLTGARDRGVPAITVSKVEE